MKRHLKQKIDPRPQNKNGRLFEEFLDRHPNLTVVNATNMCEGRFTRVRNISKTIIDFFVVCDQILPLVSKMKVDDFSSLPDDSTKSRRMFARCKC